MVDLAGDIALAGMERDALGASAVVLSHADQIADHLASLPPCAFHSSYQTADFLNSWIATSGEAPRFVVFKTASGDVMLPLCDAGGGVLRYAGDRHANGNFPVGLPDAIAALRETGLPAVKIALKKALKGYQLVLLERQHASLFGIANPFVSNASVKSPNVALSFKMSGDFDALLDERNGKRLRKKWRASTRKLEEMGTLVFEQPVTQADIAACLNDFFEMKAKRFEAAGIRDVFSDDAVQTFFNHLFEAGWNEKPRSRELHSLTLDGQRIAIAGCSLHKGRIIVEFGTFDEAFAHASTGDLLFFELIKHMCGRGLSHFDFGIGDEPYKRRWCDIETDQFDTMIALNVGGHAVALRKSARAKLVRTIKNNDRLWQVAKTIRRLKTRMPGA